MTEPLALGFGKDGGQEMNDSERNINHIQEDLAGIVGAEWVLRKGGALIVKPRTAAAVAAVLRKANQTGTPVRPKGGGTGW